MIKDIEYYLIGSALAWKSVDNIVGLSFVVTNPDATNNATAQTAFYLFNGVPAIGQEYKNAARVLPSMRGVHNLKWLLTDSVSTTVGYYGRRLTTETDLVTRLAAETVLSVANTENLLVKAFDSLNDSLTYLGVVYRTLAPFVAIQFDELLYTYTVATMGEYVPFSGNVKALQSGLDKIEYFPFTTPTLDFTPLDEFVANLIAIPEIAAGLTAVDLSTFKLNGIRRDEALRSDTESGTVYPIPVSDTIIEDQGTGGYYER